MNNNNKSEIQKAYDDVRDDKTETNWMLLEFSTTKKDELQVASTGSDGLTGLVKNLKQDSAAFGYIRMVMANDEHSQRTKFVFLTWCGPQTPLMRKARLSVQKADVKNVIGAFSIEIAASEISELQEENILIQLKRAGGANYDRQTSGY
ncbi:hypothetical protein H4R99_006246 [Coemansia sp. RSA 1722]|nr:hypothetical protein IWW45_005671 [Coemansia sp. RSA 485]KAJ2592950.1 hypothetical protein H4R99_006246 [Coemansia sp. RSA 1722]